jgi:hypothetical protein
MMVAGERDGAKQKAPGRLIAGALWPSRYLGGSNGDHGAIMVANNGERRVPVSPRDEKHAGSR